MRYAIIEAGKSHRINDVTKTGTKKNVRVPDSRGSMKIRKPPSKTQPRSSLIRNAKARKKLRIYTVQKLGNTVELVETKID